MTRAPTCKINKCTAPLESGDGFPQFVPSADVSQAKDWFQMASMAGSHDARGNFAEASETLGAITQFEKDRAQQMERPRRAKERAKGLSTQ